MNSNVFVSLQTATLLAQNPKSKEHLEVNVLFDLGSQQSYITSSLSESLSLDVVSHKSINLSVFGCDKSETKRLNEVVLSLHNRHDNSVRVPFRALTTEKISTPIQTINTQVLKTIQNSFLNKIQLSDKITEEPKKSVDILIGADQYHSMVTGQSRKLKSGLVATQTIFGWSLSGPIHVDPGPISNSSSASFLCLTESVERFWQLESLGIRGNEVYDRFQDTVIQKGDTRYVVQLPTNERLSKLPDNKGVALRRLNNTNKKIKSNNYV